MAPAFTPAQAFQINPLRRLCRTQSYSFLPHIRYPYQQDFVRTSTTTWCKINFDPVSCAAIVDDGYLMDPLY